MKLYLLTRTDGWDYDTHDAFVAAESEENALEWHPRGDKRELSNWDSLVEKVIIASFNAG